MHSDKRIEILALKMALRREIGSQQAALIAMSTPYICMRESVYVTHVYSQFCINIYNLSLELLFE